MSEFRFNTPEELIADIKAGKLVIIADDENRENEGDLVGAAELITPTQIAFMATQGCGLICCPITAERAAKLNLVTPANLGDRFGTAFTQSVDAREGVTTGISAFDRHAAVRALIDDDSTPDSFVSPGHSFPLIARPGGVLRRAGHTEAAVDLPRLAGLKPAGVICEIMNPDGTMARMPQLDEFFAAKDWKQYAIITHAMKQNALNIGAENFSKYSLEHELAGKADNEAFITAEYPKYKATLSALYEKLK